jgi:hypothetical protein
MQVAVGTFDDYVKAQRAVDRLVQAGFGHMDVHIEVGPGAQTSRPKEGKGILASFGYAFVSMFGKDTRHQDIHAYAEAVNRGHSMVMVYVGDDQERQRALEVMYDSTGVRRGS